MAALESLSIGHLSAGPIGKDLCVEFTTPILADGSTRMTNQAPAGAGCS